MSDRAEGPPDEPQGAPALKQPAARAEPTLSEEADEIFRGLWASLFYSGRVKGKSVLICSASRREGASTIACGLALAGTVPAGAARVALVDFNLRHPALHEMLGVVAKSGVAQIPTGQVTPEGAVQRVNDALDVYTSGDRPKHILDILRSQALKGFLETLAEGYDHVLMDVAAVNQYPDAAILAGLAENVVVVARTDQTPREAVAHAIKRLESGGGRIVGTVLNLRTYPVPRFLYRRV